MNGSARWSAVVARDPVTDGKFVYAVKTTKIFCRPTCKARLARRSNVEFFDHPAEAQAAGYRECKRCQPLLTGLYTPEVDKVKRACDLLAMLPDNAPLPGLERLAKEAHLTKHDFHRLFKKETGLTPREYAIATLKASKSEASSSTNTTPITPLSGDVQATFNSEDHNLVFMDFDESAFANESPVNFDYIFFHYNIVETTYGRLLIAFQYGRICKLEFGGNDTELLANLDKLFPALHHFHYPSALATTEAETFQRHAEAVVEALETPSGKILLVPITLSL
ncbi:hypothetical protein LTR37_004399 [Vermiconidia calcicola]|uniref:Uncharacterized protein n=1 Tax=Vermiconidia calcicola TaxID=1690605 RepID=A0ACC3NM92_9PEZI|nr:hypothetical protein LTR37_004399 [Vermiconidia calcicola]